MHIQKYITLVTSNMSIINYDEFIKVNNGKKLFKLFPKNLKCYDIQYCENATFIVDNFDDTVCNNGIHVTTQDYIFHWLKYRGETYYFCEIIPNVNAKFVIFDDKIKTNICDIGKLFDSYEFIKYLHQEIRLTKEDFQSYDNCICIWACDGGHLNVVKYLHEEIGLTKEDFKSCFDSICKPICTLGYLDIIKYFYEEIGLSKEDFQSNNNHACKWACKNGHIDVVKYFHKEMRMSKEDFQSNNAYKWAHQYGYIDVVEYLHKEIGMSKKIFQTVDNYVYKNTLKKNIIVVVKYLLKKINIFS